MRFVICGVFWSESSISELLQSNHFDCNYADCWKTLFMEIVNCCVLSSAPVPCAWNASSRMHKFKNNCNVNPFHISRHFPLITVRTAKRPFWCFSCWLSQRMQYVVEEHMLLNVHIHFVSAFNFVVFCTLQSLNWKKYTYVVVCDLEKMRQRLLSPSANSPAPFALYTSWISFPFKRR